MSVYTEMLKLALEADDPVDDSLEHLLAMALSSRRALHGSGASAARLGDEIAYDVALVRMCRRLGLETGLTDPRPGPRARAMTEAALAEKLPALRASLTTQGGVPPK